MTTNCNADLGHPCDANNGEPCDRCAANIAYWKDQWERYGKYEMRGRETREQYEADVRDVYQDDEHKREVMLHELGL